MTDDGARADEVDAGVEAGADVFWRADHIHAEDTGLVQPLDDGLGANTDGADKELDLFCGAR
jgi:hypothetical protein